MDTCMWPCSIAGNVSEPISGPPLCLLLLFFSILVLRLERFDSQLPIFEELTTHGILYKGAASPSRET